MTVLCGAEAPHSSDPLGFLVCYLISNCVIGVSTPESDESFAGIPPTDDDKSLVQFFNLMIGDKKEVELDNHLLIVESRSYTAEVLLDCYDRCKGKGLARELLSFMVDLLKRQHSLAALTDYKAMAEASEKLECLPLEYFEWSHKDMFIALLEITPPSLHSRLVSLAVRIGCCAPFIYRRILPNGNVAMRLLLDGCRKVLDAKSNPLVLSCGTTSTVNRGKTDLIGELFGLGASSQSRARGLSLHSSSPCHNLSVDLLFNASLASGAFVVLADAHGFSSESFGFTTALGMLMSVASTTVIHVSKSDFTEQGEANDDVKNYCDRFIKNNDQFGKATGSCLILVWRDYEDKDEKRFETVKVWLERQKQDGVSLKLAKITNLKEAKIFGRQQSLNKLKNVFFETMTSHDKKTLPASCQTAEMVCRLNAIAKMNPLYRGTQEDTCVPLYTVRRKTLVKIESRTRASLDEIVGLSGSDKLSRSLFPVLTLKAEHAQLEEKKRHLAATGDVNAEHFSVQLSDLEELIKKKEEMMSAKETSSFVKDFASFALKGDLEAIDVIQQTLAKWMMFKCSPLQSECNTLKKRIDELEVDGQDKDVKAIKNKLAKIEETISAFDVSIHDVWGELISLAGVDLKDEYHRTVYRLEKECHLPRERLAQTYRDWIIQGNPMQLLRGSPLYMASEFISSILRLFQEGSDRRVFVISVIGMQSSAKSTLLNYLFGCGFETGVGRCTRGLYASYMRTNELDLLILDSEGLMAVEGEGRTFDKEITLMAMACSHVVIINHKGELARQLQELFEVAVFAMNRLEVIRVRPDVLFVLRDQIERGKSAASSLQSQLTKMLQNIKATAEKLKVEVNRYLNLHDDSLTLLPVAFGSEERNVHLPSPVFSNECIVLRKKILDLYRKKFKHHGDYSVEEFSSLQQWSVHARCVWTTIKTYGPNLLNFDNMQQIREREEAASVFAHVVAIHIENRGGYLDECKKQLQTYLKMSVEDPLHLVALGITYMAELLSRRKLCEEKADKRLSSALKGKQYLYDQYSQRLTSRINEITKHCMRGWERREMFMKEDVISAELVGKMDRRMREQNMKSVMSVRELRTALNQEWNPHVDEIQGNSWKKSKEEIFQEVLIALADHRLENINDSVFGVVTLIPKLPSRQSLATSKNADHFESFLCGKTSVQSKIPLVKFNEDQKKEAADWLKNKVCAFFEEFRTEKKEDGELELVRAFIVEAITKTRDVILLLNKQLEENFGLTAKMPTLVSDMFNCLVFETVNMLHVLQKQEEEIGVEVRRESICQKHLLLLESNRDDLQFAKAVVYDIQSGLMNFCQTKVIDIVINIDKDLRKMLPNWSTTVSIAFEESFIKGNWRSVLAFCEDASAFIRDLVYERFRCLKDAAFIGEFSVALKKITNEMALLTDIMSDWGKANKGRRKTSHLIKFGRQQIQRLTGETVDILDFIPSYLHVTDPHLFSAAFGSHVRECLLHTPITHTFEDMFEKELSAAKEKFWEDLEGCSEQCPLCSAPCDHQDKAHLQHGIKHGCQIHFLPAFHRSRNPTTKEPIFLFCSTVKERNMPVETSDAGPARAARFLNTRNWDIIPAYTSHLLTLRRAWVKCRKPILQMKDMVDGTPKEWIRLFGGGNDELKADNSK